MKRFLIELNEWINETCEDDLMQESYFWTVVLCLLTSPIYGVWGCFDEKIGTIWGVSVIGFLLLAMLFSFIKAILEKIEPSGIAFLAVLIIITGYLYFYGVLMPVLD